MPRFPVVETGNDVTLQVLADHPDFMVLAFRFGATGAVGDLHDHPYVQSTYVESGRFRFTLGNETRDDSFVIPSGLTHGCVCREPGIPVD